jgi:Na+-transporting NADH:ubiquinone oxidoreductase subunit NqrA
MSEFLDTALNNKDVIEGFWSTNLGSSLRRLTYFADKEGKTRVIAIGDYLSQTVLKGLHNYLFRLLRKIPQDMTFDQGAFVERIKD